MMKTKRELTFTEVHSELRAMGYGVSKDVLAEMTPSELHKFHKKAKRVFKLMEALENRIDELEQKVKERG